MLRSAVFGVLAMFLALTTTEVRAESVDWSEYVDHSAPKRLTTTPAPAQTKSPSNKRVAGKTVASKAKGKAKVKARAKKAKPRRR